jgi:hypothetical protein
MVRCRILDDDVMGTVLPHNPVSVVDGIGQYGGRTSRVVRHPWLFHFFWVSLWSVLMMSRTSMRPPLTF